MLFILRGSNKRPARHSLLMLMSCFASSNRDVVGHTLVAVDLVCIQIVMKACYMGCREEN